MSAPLRFLLLKPLSDGPHTTGADDLAVRKRHRIDIVNLPERWSVSMNSGGAALHFAHKIKSPHFMMIC